MMKNRPILMTAIIAAGVAVATVVILKAFDYERPTLVGGGVAGGVAGALCAVLLRWRKK